MSYLHALSQSGQYVTCIPLRDRFHYWAMPSGYRRQNFNEDTQTQWPRQNRNTEQNEQLKSYSNILMCTFYDGSDSRKHCHCCCCTVFVQLTERTYPTDQADATAGTAFIIIYIRLLYSDLHVYIILLM